MAIGKTLFLSENMMVDLLKNVQKPIKSEDKQSENNKKLEESVEKEDKTQQGKVISFKNINTK